MVGFRCCLRLDRERGRCRAFVRGISKEEVIPALLLLKLQEILIEPLLDWNRQSPHGRL